jgi:hypothetical protein
MKKGFLNYSLTNSKASGFGFLSLAILKLFVGE